MEMYCLHKYGVSIGVSGSGMAVKFIVFQVVLLVTGAVLWIAHGGFVDAHTQGSKWFILMGYVVNFFSVGMVALMAISQRAVRWVIEKCIRLGVRVRLCKDPDASRRKWENHCQSFLSSVHLVIRHPKDVIIQCLIALGQLMSLMLVIVAISQAFSGFQAYRWGSCSPWACCSILGPAIRRCPAPAAHRKAALRCCSAGFFRMRSCLWHC